jgi:RHS repeat-associated protein
VRRAATSSAVQHIEVCAEDETTFECGETDAAGKYTIPNLPAGEYVVFFGVPFELNLNYVGQYYNGKASYEAANRVVVGSGAKVTGIDAALQAGGQIVGHVSDVSTKASLAGIRVCAEQFFRCTETDASGNYSVNGLESGKYIVEFEVPVESNLNYLPQFYNAKRSRSEAEAVVVTVGKAAEKIDAAMQVGGQVTGQVSDAGTKAPIEGIEVCAFGESGRGCGGSDASGNYTINGLGSGEYTIEFNAPEGGPNYARQFYNGKTSSSQANRINVTAGSVTPGINAAMTAGGQIHGKVTAAVSKEPLEKIRVCAQAFVSGEYEFRCQLTDASGEYSIAALPAATYSVSFTDISGHYAQQFYKNAASSLEEEGVAVTAGAVSAGVDDALQVGGEIRGRVVDAVTKAPLKEIVVCAYVPGVGGGCPSTNASGEYAITDLELGQYRVEFRPSTFAHQNYLRQYYNEKATESEANLVSVGAAAVVSEINGALQPGGSITGHVTNAKTKEPITDAEVAFYGETSEFPLQYAYTDGTGKYELEGLKSGTYRVGFLPFGYEASYYNGRTSLATADGIKITAGSAATGIDGALRPLASISGVVKDATTHAARVGIEACVSSENFSFSGCAPTDSEGRYTVNGLAPGHYRVEFYDYGGGYLTQYYNHETDFEKADLVAVEAGEAVTGIDADMVAGGHITGTVTAQAGGLPIKGIQVCATAISPMQGGGCAQSAADGSYTIIGLATGSYRVDFAALEGAESANYLTQYFNGKAAESEADAVSVAAGATTEHINAVMAAGGQIHGKVTARSSEAPVSAYVCAAPSGGGQEHCAPTGTGGEYAVSSLSTGSYIVRFTSNEGVFAVQYYKGVALENEATPVAVTAGAQTDEINGQLPAAGQISGTVTSSVTSKPISKANVCLFSSEGVFQKCTSPDTTGKYTLTGLAAGQYKVEFEPYCFEYYEPKCNYEYQYYNGKKNAAEADLVEVKEATTTGEINAALVPDGEITGRVTKEDGTTALAGISVCASAISEGGYGCATTSASGEYAVQVPLGSYRVEFSAPKGLNYIRQYYQGKAGYSEATPVSVKSATATPNINAALRTGGEIAGQTTIAKTTTPIEGLEVCPSTVSGTGFGECVKTDANGDYAIEKLDTGTYKLSFFDPSGSTLNYIGQWYNGRPHYSEAQASAVTAGIVTSGINAAMEPGGEISGNVTRIINKQAIQSATVCPFAKGGTFFERLAPCAQTDASGNYTLRGLPPGLADVEFSAYPYFTQYYKEVAQQSQATDVPVEVLHVTTGINARLKHNPPLVPGAASPPTFSGIPEQGVGFTVKHANWSNEPTEYRYQWLRCSSLGLSCLPIAHATGQSHAPVAADVGGRLELEEIAVNLEGESQPATSEPSEVVVPAKPVNTGVPSFSGLTRAGQALMENHGSWTNEPTEYTYQWERCDEAGENCMFPTKSTEPNYTLVAGDVGHTMRVIETAGNAGGESDPAVSGNSAVVVPEVPTNVSPPSVSGSVVQGQLLGEAHGSWTHEPTGFSYQWERCSASGSECVAIEKATEASYVSTGEDVGHRLRVAETAGNSGGPSKAAMSGLTAVVVSAVPTNLGPPAINGPVLVGGTLTEAHGSWTNQPESFTYQWRRCTSAGKECDEITGATQQTYILESADLGHRLIVEETAHNSGGASKAAISDFTEVVVSAVPVNTSPPTISGAARQGESLEEHHGSWTNQPTSYEILWQRCDTAGENCTTVTGGGEDTSYELTSQDLGHTIRVVETASNAGGPGKAASSAPTARVVAVAPVNLTPPRIEGTLAQNETLTETHGSWTNEPITYDIKWERCSATGTECTPIEEATGQTYTLTAADVGHEMVVVETANNAAGPSKPQSSKPTAVVGSPVPINKVPPKISGVADVGATLTEENGSWSNSPTGFGYQWERCNSIGFSCLPIKEATHQTYTVEAADLGSFLIVKETAHNATGPGSPASSGVVGPVVPPPPTNLAPPTISGTAQTGQTLTSTAGSWSNQPKEFRWRWLRCDSDGNACGAIHNAINKTYMPVSGDVGHTIKFQEIAINAGGESEPALSTASAVVSAGPLQAVAGENVAVALGETVHLDGSASAPAEDITDYSWDFGDGSSGEGALVGHEYAAPGKYTAVLTVTRGSETSKANVTVTVASFAHLATVTVVDEAKQPVNGAQVLYIAPDATRTEATTKGAGQVGLGGLPDGTDTVYVYKSGFLPRAAQVDVSEGAGSATVTLKSGELAEAKLTSHEMTLAEIEAAGIDTSDPNNNNVYEFRVELPFGGGKCYVNTAGEFINLENCDVGGGGGGGGAGGLTREGGCFEEFCISADSIHEHPLIKVLRLAGKATWLKQFFAVTLTVYNPSAEPFKFTNGTASLNVPSGMSFAPTPVPQSQTQNVADIPGEGSAATNWVIRGDKAGEYYLSASYHGQLEPFKEPFEIQAATATPLKVWGAEAFDFRVQADSGSLTKGVPYHVHVGLFNKANIPLYNVSVEILSNVHEGFVFQPSQRFETNIGELKPGETIFAPEDILVPDANSVGGFEPQNASAHFVGESLHPGKGIEAVTPPPLYSAKTTLESVTLVHLHWQPSPGAEGYEVFSTPDLDTPFGGGPDSVQTSATSKATVTRLPASATDAWVPRGANDPPRFYAISTILGGQLRLEHPVKEPSLQGPAGGPLTLRELLAGGHNLSEFCVACFLGGHESFAQPVDAPTGNFWHSFTDLSVPGRGIPLNVTRTYNSGAATTNGPFGYGWSFPYGMSLTFPDATHVVVNQENGSAVEFSEEAGGKWVAPPRVTASLAHNSDGSWTFVRRHRETYGFTTGGQLAKETDLNGYTTSLTYSGSGQLAKVTDPAGRKLTFSYKKGRIVSVVDPLKRVARYEYDGAGNLSDVIDVAGGDTHFTYDAQHRMLSMRMPNQAPGVPDSTEAALHNTYDEQGRVKSQTDPMGRETTFEYIGEPLGEAGGATVITDPKGNKVEQTYQFGLLMSETRGYGTAEAATWKFEYDLTTLGMTGVTDPNGHITKTTYDSEGNILTSEDALGRKTVNTYDALNDELTTTDPLRVTTTMTYDARGNMQTRARPLVGTSQTETTTYTHADSKHPGDVTAMTDPDGKVWHYSYDTYGDQNGTIDPLGDHASSTYNADGWKLTAVSPRGNASGKPAEYTTSYSYNSFGQVTKTVDPLGHTTTSEYDPDQNLIVTTAAAGNATHYSYDADDERTAEHRANGSTTETKYWPDGSVKEQIDGAGHATGYSFDALGRRTSSTDPLGRTTHYGYDPAGNQTSLTNAEGQVMTTAYDAANEPTAITYSDGKTPNVTSIAYDLDGQRTAQTDGSGSWAWHWDSLHRLSSVTEGAQGIVSYGYDLRGLATEITYPNGKTVAQSFDAAGRLASVTDWKHYTTTFGYDVDGDVTKQIAPGITDSFAFDRTDQMLETTDKAGSTVLFAAAYARNANSQVTSDSSAPAGKGTYGYTALNQLCYAGSSSAESCAKPPASASPYAYDNADNLTQNGANSQSFDAANQVCWTGSGSGSCASPPAGATTYSYNERGDRTSAKPTSGPATLLSYDQADRLTHYAAGSASASYSYNGDGLRMSKTVGKATTGFAWDANVEMPLLLQAGKTSYVYGPEGLPLEQISKSKPEWLHHDQIGSTRLITTSAGASAGTYTYDPWGNLTSHSGSATSSLGFDGQYTDVESGYVYLRARYYDPSTTQFLTRDPIVSVTKSAFGFASGDPIDSGDPSGKVNWWHVAKIAGLVAGGVGLVACAAFTDGAGLAVCIAATRGSQGIAVTTTVHDCVTGEGCKGGIACTSLGFLPDRAGAVAGTACGGATLNGDGGGNPPCPGKSNYSGGYIDPSTGTYDPKKLQQGPLSLKQNGLR